MIGKHAVMGPAVPAVGLQKLSDAFSSRGSEPSPHIPEGRIVLGNKTDPGGQKRVFSFRTGRKIHQKSSSGPETPGGKGHFIRIAELPASFEKEGLLIHEG